jgi:hypothetical protein
MLPPDDAAEHRIDAASIRSQGRDHDFEMHRFTARATLAEARRYRLRGLANKFKQAAQMHRQTPEAHLGEMLAAIDRAMMAPAESPASISCQSLVGAPVRWNAKLWTAIGPGTIPAMWDCVGRNRSRRCLRQDFKQGSQIRVARLGCIDTIEQPFQRWWQQSDTRHGISHPDPLMAGVSTAEAGAALTCINRLSCCGQPMLPSLLWINASAGKLRQAGTIMPRTCQ